MLVYFLLLLLFEQIYIIFLKKVLIVISFLCNIRRTYLMNSEVTKGYCISMSD